MSESNIPVPDPIDGRKILDQILVIYEKQGYN